jgi:hypothetical protein
LARTIGTLLDPAASAVVLPYELVGAPGLSHPMLFGVLPPVDAVPVDPSQGAGFLGRLLARRTARKEGTLALARTRWILAPGEAERDAFLRAAASAAPRTVLLPAAVADPPGAPDREAARRLLHLPDDVPVAAWIAPAGFGGSEPLALAAFERSRVFFPGARLLIVGAAAPSQAGVQSFPAPEAEVVAAARRAADVIIAPAPSSAMSVLSAVRAGAAPLVGRTLTFPRTPPDGSIRRPEADDAGSLASSLAELFADLALRRKVAEAGRSYADGYSPERTAAIFLTLLTGNAPTS